MNTLNKNELGILWDMDGVLVDSGELHLQTWQAALKGIWARLHQRGIPRHLWAEQA